MNKLFGIVFLAVVSFSYPTTQILAQSECFMQGNDGRNIDLSRLCGDGQNNTQTKPRNPNFFSLPIKRRIGGTPTVDVTFNGKHRYEMLFDTGASSTVITADMAEAMGVKKEREIAARTAGGIVTAYLGRITSLESGNLAQKNLVIGISDHMDGLGLLGQDFFGNYDVTIKKDEIVLRPRSASKK
ncbi:aspartyl protease [Aphanothece hegewaldii CCALA 016]|uniref:Aspartyl protease n=1 Tax=Aphanothece hegewaldii CCALA 016 TaxID=2107694 RepID=A0A2T1M1X6_9CHRO|nr:retroviral-like aspartic protease family protein [Aphanothece hegewaldii]PSF38635.1 aspartyl protease [Aphanothece hegewaldii CCALA 016]